MAVLGGHHVRQVASHHTLAAGFVAERQFATVTKLHPLPWSVIAHALNITEQPFQPSCPVESAAARGLYRDDVLARAYAQCRSNKGAPGVDGQDFADIDTYGVERWLGELALALRQETYRPSPIRRVFIPKANGKLRPLGISTVRDRVCMTVAKLVLEPIFEANLLPEQYAYGPGRNAQQAVDEVGELLYWLRVSGAADPGRT